MIFVTGGARSGKSGLAEKIARGKSEEVTYIATAEPRDGEMRERIAEHRRRRPSGWRTVEAFENLPQAVGEALEDDGVVLIDCLTVYISNLLITQGIATGEHSRKAIDREIDQLVEVCRSGNGRVILVSNEVGMGIVPDNSLARTFRDAAGRANQKLAAAAEEVYLCVSGIPVKVK
ncbi:MAG: bifunctional adenosylcobinamide kinase/adenosylcobinamide-phosphate guanylyltransferase [Actinobacteria bacterium]|nr:bifunctional adenosylcobinamide kinase/adenosylcobinamide-phosphate guanylyltransferase [Actinomycetota bacterium]MCL5883643.1 bifunctional adenosylcobinamide kinase/adenosylcobinamide-phosphate guanylyltransferase [Actinomycetota bacterium]